MSAKRKFDYKELYLFAKEHGKKAAQEAFGASEATVQYVVSIADAILGNNPVQRDAKTIDKFTPRELMSELARRGYEGKLTFRQVIDIKSF